MNCQINNKRTGSTSNGFSFLPSTSKLCYNLDDVVIYCGTLFFLLLSIFVRNIVNKFPKNFVKVYKTKTLN